MVSARSSRRSLTAAKAMPGGSAKAFLARCQGDIDAPVINAQLRAQEAADRVDEEQRIRVPLDHLGDLAQGVGDARAGFIMHDANGIIAVFFKRLGHQLRPMRLSPRHINANCLFAIGAAYLCPAFAEGAASQMQHFPIIAHAAANRAFPQSRPGRAADIDAAVGEEGALELVLQAREELGEFRRAMADHPAGLRLKNLRAHFYWSGQE